MVNNVYAYSKKMKGNNEWDALKSDAWLHLLQDICTKATSIARKEQELMERDLEYYQSIFPLSEAAALQWPMGENGHWYRQQLTDLLIN